MKTEMKLPLCLHEAAIERHFVTDPSTGIREHDSYLEKALSAMRLSRQMGEKVLHSHSAIESHPDAITRMPPCPPSPKDSAEMGSLREILHALNGLPA